MQASGLIEFAYPFGSTSPGGAFQSARQPIALHGDAPVSPGRGALRVSRGVGCSARSRFAEQRGYPGAPLGAKTRAMIWPYGETNHLAKAAAQAAGMSLDFSLGEPQGHLGADGNGRTSLGGGQSSLEVAGQPASCPHGPNPVADFGNTHR